MIAAKSKYHQAVLLQKSIDALVSDPDGIYVDATFGGGGHSREIFKRLNKGRLIAFDQDEDAFQNAINDKRFMLIRSNYRYIKNFLCYHGILQVNGLIADLGISSHQIDTAERGFSTRFEASLDMRMNRSSKLTAENVINDYSFEKLCHVFSEYGEIWKAKSVAAKIINARILKRVSTTRELMNVVKDEAERGHEHQFFSKLFQSLRIEVNEELDSLKEMMVQCGDIIMRGGRLVVISYHSLEDRIVKNFISTGNFSKETRRDILYGNVTGQLFLTYNKKPIEPSEDEVVRNPRSRSARMRVAVKN